MQKYQQPKQPDLILNLKNINIFGVHPALAGQTSTVFSVCIQLWVVTPRRFFGCASSFGWSHLDSFFGVLPALGGHTLKDFSLFT